MRKKFLIAPTIAAICFGLDQLSKSWAHQHLANGVIKSFIPGVIQFNLTTNTGSAFSLARGNNELLTLLVSLITLGIVFWMIARERSSIKPSAWELLGMGFLLGGALSNLGDRVLLGKVTDFLDFAFISFPIFNLADVCIDCGLVLIIITSSLNKNMMKSNQKYESS